MSHHRRTTANSSQKAKRTVKHQYGDPRFLDIALRCNEARRRLLGIDAPVKVAPTTPDGQPLTVEERRIHINAILTEHFGVEAVLAIDGQEEATDEANRNQLMPLLHFSGDGKGRGVRWTVIVDKADEQSQKFTSHQ